jgi:metal-dependent hydrolase (beta-lactamase superfamily II)
VLSHGHYDHTGGSAFVLDQNRKARLFPHPDGLNPRFSRHADQNMHSIGNTLNYISKLTNARTFHAVIGGMHLSKAGPERLAATAAAP